MVYIIVRENFQKKFSFNCSELETDNRQTAGRKRQGGT